MQSLCLRRGPAYHPLTAGRPQARRWKKQGYSLKNEQQLIKALQKAAGEETVCLILLVTDPVFI